ncbi:MAG: rhodanese-like domain-containing protein [Candidatus Promineifilaceae bacterium]
MYRKLFLLSVLLLALLLVACGGESANAPVVDQVSVNQAPAVDVSALPDTVDVHTVASIKDQDDVYVIDVREQWEYDEGHIPGVTLIPMNEVPDRLEEIPTDKDVIVTCRSGNRSGQITEYLRQIGYDNVHNMSGGIIAWEAEGYQVDR